MSPIFVLLSEEGEVLLSVEGDSPTEPEAIRVLESVPYGFLLEAPERDQEYRVSIGDLDPERSWDADPSAETAVRGQSRYARSVEWPMALHFESARGTVRITLRSRQRETTETWKLRACLPVVVSPNKMGELRYRVMVRQLTGLAAGLVLDLWSKSRTGVEFRVFTDRVAARSNQLDLRLLEQVWGRVSPALERIEVDPWAVLRRVQVPSRWRGWGRLSRSGAQRLASRGSTPSRAAVVGEVVLQERLVESVDTAEHRLLLTMLLLLLRRVQDCLYGIRREMDVVQLNKEFRSAGWGPQADLYESEDLPRLMQLHAAQERAERILRSLQAALRLPFLRDLSPLAGWPEGPVFEHIEPYHEIARAITQYLRAAPVIVDEGMQERVKSTSRMYEQWVFLQLVAALRRAGLSCPDTDRILRRVTSHRFTVDLERDLRLDFADSGGRRLRVRYEPWILPEETALERGDTLFRASGDRAWSPDVVLEFLGEGALSVEYAVVLDAKYTRMLREHHWDGTSKYFEIRATADRRSVVHQLWLAYPSSQPGIEMVDRAVRWTASGPDQPRTERLSGQLAISPPETLEVESEDWIPVPEPVMCDFVEGLLRYMEYR